MERNKLLIMRRVIVFLGIIFFSLFLNSSDLIAKEIKDNVEYSLPDEAKEIKIDENNNTEKSNSSMEDIFGDEQTFPFVAGLGKNAAH